MFKNNISRGRACAKGERIFRVGYEYRNARRPDDDDDSFLSWFKIPDYPGLDNSRGIRKLDFINPSVGIDMPAYVVLTTKEGNSSNNHNPWEDIIDYGTGSIQYWGDAKYQRNLDYNQFQGNKILEKIHYAVVNKDYSIIPPILHFRTIKSGLLEFCGLCVMDRLELARYDDKGKPVMNYKCHLTILDADVDVSWLHNRALACSIDEMDTNAPSAWIIYKKGKRKKLEIWKSKIKKPSEQLPLKGTLEWNILSQLIAIENPYIFENLIISLFKEIKSVSHRIEGTPPSKDGGFDFFGEFILPPPLSYNINFLGEVKKYCETTYVKPKDLSRLVARLSRGQYGIFVTTSYFSEQAQKEVILDNYPVRLISGLDLVNIFKELDLINDGKINEAWLSSITETEYI